MIRTTITISALLTCAATQVAAQLPDELSVDLSSGYESKYVTSGAQAAEGSLQSEIALSYQNWAVGVWSNLAIENRDNYGDEYNFYAAYEYPLSETFAVAGGITYYYFPQDYLEPSRTRELNLALSADVYLSPTAYFNYDVDLEQWELGIEGGYDWELADQWTLTSGAAIGYIHANDGDSNQVPGKPSDGYGYAEAAINVEYALDERLTISAGPRVSANNNGDANTDGDESEIWFGAAVSYSY